MYVPHSPIPSSAHSLADYAQRTRLLSLYSHGCILDTQGWYSITPESIAHQIAYRCSLLTSTNTNTRMKEGRVNLTILDPFCGVGGNVLAFASVFERGQSSSSYQLPSAVLHTVILPSFAFSTLHSPLATPFTHSHSHSHSPALFFNLSPPPPLSAP